MKEIDRHVDPEDLERYSMGTTSPAESTVIEEHLLTCDSCEHILEEADDYSAAMRLAAEQWRREAKEAKGRVWQFPAWFPAMAAAACGLLLVVGTLHFVQPSEPAVAVSLTALRSNGAGGSAPARRELLLHPDLTGLADDASYRLEIVDQTGHTVRQGGLARGQDGIKFAGLRAGPYFVRVYLQAGELLREYGLEIR